MVYEALSVPVHGTKAKSSSKVSSPIELPEMFGSLISPTV